MTAPVNLSARPDPFGSFDVLERALRTAAQVFIAAVPLNIAALPLDEARAVAYACMAAALGALFSAFRAFVAQRLRAGRAVTDPVANLADRVVWTFLAGAFAMIPFELEFALDWWAGVAHAAVASGIASVIALAKNLTAEGVLTQAALRAGEPPSGHLIPPARRR